MAGSRPNCSRFESQVLVLISSVPYRRTAGCAVQAILRTMNVTSTTTDHANTCVVSRTTRSTICSPDDGGREIETARARSSTAEREVIELLDVVERFQTLRCDAVRQRDIAKFLADCLARSKAVPHEILERVSGLRIRVVPVRQQPRVSDDWVGAGRIGIGNEQTQVLRKRRACQGRLRRGRARLDILARLVLEPRERQPRRFGIAVFDEPDRTGVLFDRRGDAVVVIAADARRPIGRLAGSGAGLPLRTDLAQVLSEGE